MVFLDVHKAALWLGTDDSVILFLLTWFCDYDILYNMCVFHGSGQQMSLVAHFYCVTIFSTYIVVII